MNSTPATSSTFYQIVPQQQLLQQRRRHDAENWSLCSGCTQCCEYISLEIDRPTNLKDVDNVMWYLIHKNVWVWIDHDGKWYLQFNTPCEKLGDSGRCTWYEHRPKICQDYDQAECPRYTHGSAEKFLFKNEDDFMQWLAGHRNKKMRSLHQRYFEKRAKRWQKSSIP